MSGGISNPSPLSFTAITTVLFQVAAGAAGYVDTDVSGGIDTDLSRTWVIHVSNGGNNTVGARPNGSSVDNKTDGYATLLTKTNSNGHIDFYRNAAADNYYRVIGYLR